MAGVAYQYFIGAILAAIARTLFLGILINVYLQIRRAPRELLQLRIFQKADVLGRGLVAMGIGIVGGIFLMLPIILQVDVPALLELAGGVPSFALFLYGMIVLFRVFRFPRIVASEVVQGGGKRAL